MTREVRYAPSALRQIDALYLWIADRSGFPERAEKFVVAIADFCETLADTPFIGIARDDLRPGMRTIGFRRRVVIAFAVDEQTVDILGLYYGGQDYETLISGDAR